jgi:hypothetical protein
VKIFLSSTFRDLVSEREAVLQALAARQQPVLAMEYFLADSSTPLETALRYLRNCDVVLVLVGFEAGSLLPNHQDMTYTRAEYDEAVKLGKHILGFVKVGKKWPWSRREQWLNKERRPVRSRALAALYAEVNSRTRASFTTPDGLALRVIQSLDNWESQGRPGARKTFASAAEYFPAKAPHSPPPLLDFSTPLFGRDDELITLNAFLNDDLQRACILSGRGGIGKTKLLHDWSAGINDKQVLYLKDEPLWDENAEKEIPVGQAVIIVDDAHRSNSLQRIGQIFKDPRRRTSMKLLLSTRPGGTALLTRSLQLGLDPSEITVIPELKDLRKEEARALAREVLGRPFSIYAHSLAEIAGYTPLVIVAGGRLIASHRVSPSELTNMHHFRQTVFNRFLDELHLEGSDFQISPTRPLLDLIAALGPVDVDSRSFLAEAEKFLNRRADEILSTIDSLAATGILSKRGSPIRVLPDVLSDFILEDRCVGQSKVSTGYADQIYHSFGAESFRSLMRNLSELDWRLERAGYGLDLLSAIWHEIESDFINGDEYRRHSIFEELSHAAIYQPDHILRLARLALNNPIPQAEGKDATYRAGQAYVLESLPNLLMATAQHPEYIQTSVDMLWDLSRREARNRTDSGAIASLKQLASYHLNGWPHFNFAMLLQAIRLCQRPEAFHRKFTPFALIDQLLEREGEFNDLDGNVMTFGGFALNFEGVGLLRQNILEFLEYCLNSGPDILSAAAASSLGRLLPAYLTRVGRHSDENETKWQNEERLRALQMLFSRYDSAAMLVVRTEVYRAIRSGTGIQCPEPVRNASKDWLAKANRDPDQIVFDALCTGDTDLPMLTEFNAETWEMPIKELMESAHSALTEIPGARARVNKLVSHLRLASGFHIEPRGFSRLARTFAGDAEFAKVLAEQLLSEENSEEVAGQLSIALDLLHSTYPADFHAKADNIFKNKNLTHVRAASSALRVYSNTATADDIAQIKRFLSYPDQWVKGMVLQAIAYMGKNVESKSDLLDAALSVDVDGSAYVASHLAEVFGPYGVPLSLLNEPNVSQLLRKFLQVEDLDADQGRILRLLSKLVVTFSDDVVHFLLTRIRIGNEESREHKWRYRSLNFLHGTISFESLAAERRVRLAAKCLDEYFASNDEVDCYAKLFWMVSGTHAEVLDYLVAICDGSEVRKTEQLATLISKAPGQLALSHSEFAKSILGKLSGSTRNAMTKAFVGNAHSFPSGVFSIAPVDERKEHQDKVNSQIENFPTEGDLADLADALKQSIRFPKT